jgi:hypothetical protein
MIPNKVLLLAEKAEELEEKIFASNSDLHDILNYQLWYRMNEKTIRRYERKGHLITSPTMQFIFASSMLDTMRKIVLLRK